MRSIGTSPWPCTNAAFMITRETLYAVLHTLEPHEVVVWLALEARAVWNEEITAEFVAMLPEILPGIRPGLIEASLHRLNTIGWLRRRAGGGYLFPKTMAMGDDLAVRTRAFVTKFPVESGAAEMESESHLSDCGDCNPECLTDDDFDEGTGERIR